MTMVLGIVMYCVAYACNNVSQVGKWEELRKSARVSFFISLVIATGLLTHGLVEHDTYWRNHPDTKLEEKV